MDGATNITGALTTTGEATLNSTLSVSDATQLSSTLDVNGTTNITGALVTTGDVSFNSRLQVGGDVSLNGDLTI